MANESKTPFIHGLRDADLTAMQRSFVMALVRQGCNPTQAARQAGYSSPRTAAYDLLRNTAVQAAVSFERNRYVSAELANVATATLHAVMTDPDEPAAARVSAARTVLEMAGDLGCGNADFDDDRPLTDLSAQQLEQLICQMEGEHDALGAAAVVPRMAH